MRSPQKVIPNPGAGATVDIYDDGVKEAGPVKAQPTVAQRFRLVVNADQVVNIRQMWAGHGGTLRQIGADEPTVANTPETYERVLYPGRNVFRIVTTTGPTLWEAAQETVDQA